MPRIRSIKPDFFMSEDVSALPLRARLTWIGLWTQCDDHGRTKDSTRLIKAALWPLDDVRLVDVEEDLSTLADHGRIVRYIVDGRTYLAVVNWHVHQAINRSRKPRHPAPPIPTGPTTPGSDGYCPECSPNPHARLREDTVSVSTPEFMAQPVDNTGAEAEPAGQGPSVRAHGRLTDDSLSPHAPLTPGKERKGKEGTRARTTAGTLTEPSADEEPPLRCPKHEHDPTPPPCGACADTRRQHNAWSQRQRNRPTPTASAPPCPRHPDQPASRCSSCDDEAAPPPDLRALRQQQTRSEAS